MTYAELAAAAPLALHAARGRASTASAEYVFGQTVIVVERSRRRGDPELLLMLDRGSLDRDFAAFLLGRVGEVAIEAWTDAWEEDPYDATRWTFATPRWWEGRENGWRSVLYALAGESGFGHERVIS